MRASCGQPGLTTVSGLARSLVDRPFLTVAQDLIGAEFLWEGRGRRQRGNHACEISVYGRAVAMLAVVEENGALRLRAAADRAVEQAEGDDAAVVLPACGELQRRACRHSIWETAPAPGCLLAPSRRGCSRARFLKYWSQTYIPTLKESPSDAEIDSHKLMLRAGLVRKLSGGLYTFLPAGLRVMQKVSQICREEMDQAAAIELAMPLIHPANNWVEGPRWAAAREIMYRVDHGGAGKGRAKEPEHVLGPTHEEIITPLVKTEITRYRDLPKNFYQIGTKYSEKFGAVYTDDQKQSHPMVMGCYGIGISRTLQAVIEQNNDADGIVWPWQIAPWQVLVVNLDPQDAAARDLCAKLAADAEAAGADVLVDDRAERPGVKFKDADLIGLPLRLTVGGKGLKEGIFEFKWRKAKEVTKVPIADADRVVAEAVRQAAQA